MLLFLGEWGGRCTVACSAPWLGERAEAGDGLSMAGLCRVEMGACGSAHHC